MRFTLESHHQNSKYQGIWLYPNRDGPPIEEDIKFFEEMRSYIFNHFDWEDSK
jgi:hypothetical protein